MERLLSAAQRLSNAGIYFIILLWTFSVHATIEIANLEEIASLLKNVPPDSLIVFDIDEVLITSKDQFFHPLAEEFILNLAIKEMEGAKTDEERKLIEEALSLSLIETERVLLEETSPELFKTLKEKNIKTIALTSFPTGKFGLIPSLEHLRIEHLKTLGFDFSFFFPSFKISSPLFEEGILFSRGHSKGEVLLAFLDHIAWKPSEVFFIDDLHENLESMKESLLKSSIPLYLFRYTGADLTLDQIDWDRIQLQFRILIDQRMWVSDEKLNANNCNHSRDFKLSG